MRCFGGKEKRKETKNEVNDRGEEKGRRKRENLVFGDKRRKEGLIKEG